MTPGFQKPANNPQELPSSHPGIIDDAFFDTYFQLRCYKPPSDLEPFVTHIWIQRQRRLPQPTRKPPAEILSGPNIYLFLTQETAFVHPITRGTFEYEAFASQVVAGVKFQPGGFYPFLDGPISETNNDTFSVASIFPAITETFRSDLLKQSDSKIKASLETLLRDRHPKKDKKLTLITNILNTLDNDSSLRTVESVARAFHTSERTLQLLFQTHVGVGLKWVIARKRLLKTVDQIKKPSTDSSQAEIAAELGYNSQSHFTREFKALIGQPPSEYFKTNE